MNFNELNSLIKSGKPALAVHALHEWEKDFSSHPEPLQHAIKSSDAQVLELALQLAEKYHPLTLGPAITGLLKSDQALIRRLAVQSLLPVMGKPAEDGLKALFPDEKDVFVLASAVTAAARLKIGLEYIRPYFNHPDIRLRANTVRAAAILGQQLLPGLLEPFLNDPALRVQNEALKGLAILAPEKDLEQLVLQRLNSTDAPTRAATIFITGELPLTRKTVFLISALSDLDNRVSGCAVRSLAILRDPLGMRALFECMLTSADEKLAMQVLKQLQPQDAARLVAFADNLGRPATALPVLISRVLLAAESFSDWEPFLPWVLGGANRKEIALRQQALRFIARHIDFFRSNIGPLIEKAEASMEPVDIALAAVIRWKAGQTDGLARLRQLLSSTKIAEARAAYEVLLPDKSLIAKNLLSEARARGLGAEPATETQNLSGFKLPRQ